MGQGQNQTYPHTLSSVLLDTLTSMDATYLFGVAGSAERDFFDTLARDEYQDKFTFIQGNSEYPAARMSLGYARAAERVTPLILHVHLGPANAALAVLDAYISTIPLLVFTVGHISHATDYRESLYGYPRTPELLREYCKHVYRIVDSINADKIIKRALRLAETPPTGPVFLTVSQDVIEAPLPRKVLKKTISAPPTAPAHIIRDATDALKHATTPVILTQRTRNQASVPLLVKVAERLGAAVFEIRPCYMNFPCSHPLHQGYSRDEASMMRQYLQSCDLVLALDCFSPPEVDSAFNIQVSDNPFAFTETADINILSPTVSFLEAVLQALTDTDVHLGAERINRLQARHDTIRQRWGDLLKKRYSDDLPSPQRIWYEINRIFHQGRDHIVFFAPGFTQRQSLLRYLERDVPGCFYSALSAGMGSAGEAIGIQLAEKRRVLCVLGDFEAHMAQLPTLLWTCAHHAIPVAWIVLDNGTGATVKGAYWRYGKFMRDTRRFVGVDLDEPRTDWVKIAEANHVKALRCDHSEELRNCLEHVASTSTPILLSLTTQAFEQPPEGF